MLLNQIDDVEAIHGYILNLTSKTTKAETLKTQFLEWYEKASWWDKNLSQEWYNEMRSRRNAINIANAITPADKAAVQQTLTSGLTNEQLQGKPRPTINVKTGKVGKADPLPVSEAGVPVLTRILKSGLNGSDVKAWQSFLGLTPPTGYFDALTVSKTRAFQTAHHLTVDGAVGPKTWAAAFPVVASPLADDAGGFATASVTAKGFAPSPTSSTAFAPSPGTPKAQPKTVPQGTIPTVKAAVAPHVNKVITAGLDPSKWSTGAKVVGLAAGALLVAGNMKASPLKHHSYRGR